MKYYVASTPGMVYLVGGGPGDPGLITVRGVECLQQAEVVIHDFLLNPALLAYAPPGAEIINVAQLPERHPRPLTEITALMITKARQGHTVVRLKGGDPLVFGRGGEEALALAEAGIPFKIVPGVTSASAVPSYAGIPITQRGIASSLAVVASHNVESAEQVDWLHLAHGADTLVLLMGVETLPYIVERLLAAGRAPETPVAVIERGTHPMQHTVVGTLTNIIAQAAALRPPALIVVGEVVKLRDQLRWFDRPDQCPLLGLRILNTGSRPVAAAEALTRYLTDAGAEVIDQPAVQAALPPDTGSLDAVLAQRLQHPRSPLPYDWVLFPDADAVNFFMNRLLAQGGDARALARLQLGAISPATAQALRGYGLAADLVLAPTCLPDGLAGRRVLLPHEASTLPPMAGLLCAHGTTVEPVAAYALLPVPLSPPISVMLRRGQFQAAVFFSSTALRSLANQLGEEMRSLNLVCADSATAAAAYDLGLPITMTVATSTAEAIAAALVAWRQGAHH